MNEKPKYSEEVIHKKLAEEYSHAKKNSIVNILNCGKILFLAKRKLDGEFHDFLNDDKVGESLRTAQRLIAIYKRFMHLLDTPENELDTFSNLGVTSLLEFSKLPDKFLKTVDIDIEGEGHKEKVEVVDEKELDKFLNKTVHIDGKIKAVKNLPVAELKKVILEEKGQVQEKPKTQEKEVIKKNDSLTGLDSLFQESFGIVGKVRERLSTMDEVTLYELPSPAIKLLKTNLTQMKGLAEALIVRINDLEDKL